MQELIARLVDDTNRARDALLAEVAGCSDEAGLFSPSRGAWCIGEVLEHLVLAEWGGINRIWRAAGSWRRGEPEWIGEPVHRGKSIEEIVAGTWEERVEAPEVARPRWGGPAGYWASCLDSCRVPLAALAAELEGLPVDEIIYPHPISGPLDARQRLEFLRFHIERHRHQVQRIKQAPGYPA